MLKMKKLLKVFFAMTLTAFLLFSFECLAAKDSLESAQSVKIKAVQNLSGCVKISWEKFDGALSYELEKKMSNGKWQKIYEGETRTYKDSEVEDGKVYFYRVRAVLENSVSAFGTKSTKFLKAPSLKSVKNSTNGVLIKWEKCQNATGYKIYRKSESAKKYKLLKTVGANTLNFTDKKATGFLKYTYKIKQQSANYISATSEVVSLLYVPCVKNVTAKNSPNGIKITWNSISSSKGYSVWRKISGEEWKKIGVSKGEKNYYIDKKCTYGKKAYYKVRAYYNAKNYGVFGNTASLYTVNPNKKMVALTYDDGPYTPVTGRILDCLEKNKARATFFVVGSRVDTYSDCIKREAKLGCEIANHTYSHTSLTKLSKSDIKNEIEKTDNLIKKYTGNSVNLVRAPGGAVNQTVKDSVSHPLINWSVDTLDWSHRTASKTVSNIKANVRDGSIVLMHDLYSATADASETIIPYLVKNGYQLVTVSEMMDAKGVTMKNGNLYRSA